MPKFIFSHNPGSRGAGALAQAMGVRRVKHVGSRVRLGGRDVLINWGHGGALPDHVAHAGRVLNRPNSVATAANKANFFRAVGNQCRLVPWTTDRDVARGWGSRVVVRHTLNGHSGEGIEIVEAGVDIPVAPCYTKYIPKESEWRIHVVNGQVIDYARKIRDPDFTGEPNWAVRNHANGFIFARNSGQPTEDIIREAVAAVEAVGLDFGAVDVLVSKPTRSNPQRLAMVLEINTAPGLEGQTVQSYAQAFNRS